jgi:hypothetical protein
MLDLLINTAIRCDLGKRPQLVQKCFEVFQYVVFNVKDKDHSKGYICRRA